MRLKQYSIVILLAISLDVSAQENLFLNQSQSLVFLNPSFAGSNGFVRDQGVYKKNFTNTGNMVNFANALDVYLKPIRAGIAASYSYSDFDFTKADKFSLAYAQYFSTHNKKIDFIPSVQISYGQRVYDATSAYFIQPTTEITNTTTVYFDMDAGLLVKVRNLYIGSTLSHINQPEIGLLQPETAALKFGLHGSYNLIVSEKTVVNFLASYAKQGSYEGQFQLASNAVVFKHLLIGLGYASNNGIFANIGFRTNCFTASFLYSTNTNISNDNYFNESIQLMLAYQLRKKDLRKTLGNFESW